MKGASDSVTLGKLGTSSTKKNYTIDHNKELDYMKSTYKVHTYICGWGTKLAMMHTYISIDIP